MGQDFLDVQYDFVQLSNDFINVKRSPSMICLDNIQNLFDV